MRRIRLFTLVIVLPLVAAVGFLWRRHRIDTRQAEAIRMFNRAIERGQYLPYGRLVSDFGPDKAGEYFERAAESDLIAFDGAARLAQIQRNGFTYPEGSLDLLHLHDFKNGFSTAQHEPPIGTVIENVTFVGNGIDISIHGDLLIDGSRITIPASKPEVYHLKWIPGAPPSAPPLETMIKNRQRP